MLSQTLADNLALPSGDALALTITTPAQAPPWLTLICLHGWTLDHRSFAPQAALAESGVRVVCFDRRGFGDSSLPPDFEREVDDVRAVLAHFSGPRVLYGVSQGARLALRCAVAFDDALSGVVVQGGHIDGVQYPDAPGEGIPFDDYRAWLAAGDLASFRAHWVHHPLVARGFEDGPLELRLALIDRYRGHDLLLPGALPQPTDIAAALAASQVPLLTVVGSLEVSSRKAHAAHLVATMGAERVDIPGGGHLCHISHSTAVNDHLLDWLKLLAG